MHLESDLHIASFLLARGFRFLGLELVGSRYAFKFESHEDSASDAEGRVAAAIQEYVKGGLISAREFAAAIQQLKTALYAEKYKNGNGNERNYANRGR